MLVLVLLVAAAGGWWMYQNSQSSSLIDGSKYQAVLLSNGQWYFGKLKLVNDSYKLTDVFYLEQQNSQDSQKSDTTQLNDTTKPVLIKLGNEIHAPEDSMIIKSDQVVFFENIKDSGQVATLMKQYLDKNNN